MNNLTEQIMSITDSRDFPCCDRVEMWHIISRDPDENSEPIRGVLIKETSDHYMVTVDGDGLPMRFPKFTADGVTLWRCHRIGGH